MPRNLHYYRAECTNLLARIEDEDSADRFDAAIERFWDDQVSLEEMVVELREELRSQRMFL
jgi:hypothetical protein